MDKTEEELTELILYESPAIVVKNATELLAGIVQDLSSILQQDLKPGELAALHDFTDKTSKSIIAFKEIARERLLEDLKKHGTAITEKGTLMLDLGNGRVQVAIPTSTKPKDKLVESMLRRKGLSRDTYMDKTVTYQTNQSKLEELLSTKAITTDDYNDCFAPTQYRVGKSTIKGEEYDD